MMEQREMSTLEKILSAARQEFLEKGYPAAGLRDIAKKAGVTTGALYGYFKNKEELFRALVGEHYDYMISTYQQLLSSFSQLPPEEQQTDMMGYSEIGLHQMMEYMYAHRDAFKLILCCSQGTQYDHLVHELARMDVEATHEFMKHAPDAQVPALNPTLEHMLTSGMFATFFELIIHDVPWEDAGEYSRQMLAFYSAGWAEIMGL